MSDVIIIYRTNVQIDLGCDPWFLSLRHIVKPFSVNKPWNSCSIAWKKVTWWDRSFLWCRRQSCLCYLAPKKP